MGLVITKMMSPVRRLLLALPFNRRRTKEDPRTQFLQQLALLERGERDDYEAALALERGQLLPPPTQAQLEMGKVSFSELLEKFLVADTVSERATSKNTTVLQRRKTQQPASVECVVCRDDVECIACLTGLCGHSICRQCVLAMAEVANKNEELFPLQCCQKELPMDAFLSFLPDSLRTTFSSKCAEAATPPNLRIYCPNQKCSNFIGRSPASTPCRMSCPKCRTGVCSGCKDHAHSGESCSDNGARKVRSLAKDKRWKTCPKCEMIVERSMGCRFMVCRCRQQFCYDCGKVWRKCSC